MFGLEFAPFELVNAVAGGAIGAALSLSGAWVLAKRQLRNFHTLARFLDEALDAESVEIRYGDGGRLLGLILHYETQPEGVQSTQEPMSATVRRVSDEEGSK